MKPTSTVLAGLGATLLTGVAMAQDTRPGQPMVVTAGNDVAWQVASPRAAIAAFAATGALRCGPERLQAHWQRHGHQYAAHGVTAFEPYVKWMLLEPEEGRWDPSFYDAELACIKAHGLRWVPFLIAGPAYATPPWFKESPESVFAVDVTTGDVSRDQSIWNPHLRPRIRAWLQRFFEHYDTSDMQAVLLGISGVFGESIYTAGGNVWTQLWDGTYPQHLGWWCGDRYAQADFRATMRAKYETIEALNTSWQSACTSFADITPFVPDEARSNRARLDLVQWYTGAMTSYAEWWIETVRQAAPEVPVLLCTGGSAHPALGADMAAQTRMAARHGAGMRITNEASDYTMNVHLTRHISSAARLYGTYFGYEPAGAVTTDGIVARIYNAVASGAWELFHYDNPPAGERGQRYLEYVDLLRIREPVVTTGFFWSRVSADLLLDTNRAQSTRLIRDVVDVDYVDERMIEDGALRNLDTLVWAAGPITEPDTAAVLRQAVENGLALLVPAGWKPTSPEGTGLFPAALTSDPGEGGTYAVAELPHRKTSGAWREGLFHGAEPDSVWGTPYPVCWTSGTVALHLPLLDTPARATIAYRVGNLAEPVQFVLDGALQTTAARGTQGALELDVPRYRTPGQHVVLEIRAVTWTPADAQESRDTRALSVMLRDVTITPLDNGAERPAKRTITRHRHGRGCVVEAAGMTPTDVAAALGAMIAEPDAYGLRPQPALVRENAAVDGLFIALTTTDTLVYNHTDTDLTLGTAQGPVTIPAHTIKSLPAAAPAEGSRGPGQSPAAVP